MLLLLKHLYATFYFLFHCTKSVYPTTEFEEFYRTNTPINNAGLVAVTFIFVVLAFLVYDILVTRRNKLLVLSAARSNAVVSQLFPGRLRDEIIRNQGDAGGGRGNESLGNILSGGNKGGGDNANSQVTSQPPLADLFLETTVIFADIVGCKFYCLCFISL